MHKLHHLLLTLCSFTATVQAGFRLVDYDKVEKEKIAKENNRQLLDVICTIYPDTFEDIPQIILDRVTDLFAAARQVNPELGCPMPTHSEPKRSPSIQYRKRKLSDFTADTEYEEKLTDWRKRIETILKAISQNDNIISYNIKDAHNDDTRLEESRLEDVFSTLRTLGTIGTIGTIGAHDTTKWHKLFLAIRMLDSRARYPTHVISPGQDAMLSYLDVSDYLDVSVYAAEQNNWRYTVTHMVLLFSDKTAFMMAQYWIFFSTNFTQYFVIFSGTIIGLI